MKTTTKENRIRKAVLNDAGKVIGEAFDVPKNQRTIKVLGKTSIEGDPVNISEMKTSYSKDKLERATYQQPLSRYVYNGNEYWTFLCVENNKVNY
jgi:hypothetical protein